MLPVAIYACCMNILSIAIYVANISLEHASVTISNSTKIQPNSTHGEHKYNIDSPNW
jgi:hypothetical protein